MATAYLRPSRESKERGEDDKFALVSRPLCSRLSFQNVVYAPVSRPLGFEGSTVSRLRQAFLVAIPVFRVDWTVSETGGDLLIQLCERWP
jgi:hypothetical protein